MKLWLNYLFKCFINLVFKGRFVKRRIFAFYIYINWEFEKIIKRVYSSLKDFIVLKS